MITSPEENRKAGREKKREGMAGGAEILKRMIREGLVRRRVSKSTRHLGKEHSMPGAWLGS